MQLRGTMEFNNGSLQIGGCNLDFLAKKYGTPLMIIDEALVRDNCRKYHEALKDYVKSYRLFYASKAFLSMGFCRIIEEEGFHLDVVSGGELYQAMAGDFPASKIALHGNNKSYQVLMEAINCGVASIVVDNLKELEELENIARTKALRVPVMLRVVPPLRAETHPYLDTGKGSKFGLAIEGGAAEKALLQAAASKNLLLKGLHSHLGSQISDVDIYLDAAKEIISFAEKHSKLWHPEGFSLNLGGGFAIAYQKGDPCFPLDSLGPALGKIIAAAEVRGKLPAITLELEPGRSIIGPAGTSMYTVGWTKELDSSNLIVPIDGGMSDNIRPALYGAKYEGLLLGNTQDRPLMNSMIVGQLCESGDVLIENLLMPEARPGDLFTMSCTGAYTYTMASNYNGMLKPAVILVKDGMDYPLIKRETYQDLIYHQEIPPHIGINQPLIRSRRTAAL